MEIKRSYDRFISTAGYPILVRWHLYIESGPCISHRSWCLCFSWLGCHSLIFIWRVSSYVCCLYRNPVSKLLKVTRLKFSRAFIFMPDLSWKFQGNAFFHNDVAERQTNWQTHQQTHKDWNITFAVRWRYLSTCQWIHHWLLLLTWINYDYSMDK